jgi:hypothetical protein
MKPQTNPPNRNRKVLLILDILMVLAILANCGAYAMTNAMAVKKQPSAPIYEVNPGAVATTNFAAPPKPVRTLMYVIFFLAVGKYIALGLALGAYIWFRHNANEDRKVIALCLAVSIWFTILFLNFWNDFGLWFGRVLFGS